ncbi:helix-turn-helix domain-containing protein [Streptomyces sp. NPDC096013]|uniref:helix-turn-helix domain-containing protein n=1 Tax=Streptomyces sp. NPDC096013 TaxID=3366069 RepID=UPI003821E63A
MQDPPSVLARELGRLVHDRRIKLGLSQAELAGRCGMKQPQISRFEGGGTVPTLTLLRRLAHALGADDPAVQRRGRRPRRLAARQHVADRLA